VKKSRVLQETPAAAEGHVWTFRGHTDTGPKATREQREVAQPVHQPVWQTPLTRPAKRLNRKETSQTPCSLWFQTTKPPQGLESRQFGNATIIGGPVSVDRRRHCVLPWTRRRTVLIGFNIRFAVKRLLVSLGFPIDSRSLRNLDRPLEHKSPTSGPRVASGHSQKILLPTRRLHRRTFYGGPQFQVL